VLFARDVGLDAGRAPALVLDRARRLVGFREIADDDRRAVGGEPLGEGPADAGGPARDDGNLSRQLHHRPLTYCARRGNSASALSRSMAVRAARSGTLPASAAIVSSTSVSGT